MKKKSWNVFLKKTSRRDRGRVGGEEEGENEQA